MGNTHESNHLLQKGEGYRITDVKENSPFFNQVQIFFDFIIAISPEPSEQTPAQILHKLSPQKAPTKSPLQIFNENIDINIKVKIVSTKYRNVRVIDIVPNNKWNNNNDFTGITLRKQRYDEAFDTYFPITDVKNNSPIRKAGIREGEYLIGCQEYSYVSIDAFMEGLYQRFFDKENKDKNLNLAVYDIANDQLRIKEVTLNRGWGGKGLLGCEFLQGMLNKFPTNLEDRRKELQSRQHKKKEVLKLRNELGQCDGASKSLVQAIQNQKNKKMKHYLNIKNLLNIVPPHIKQNQPILLQQKEAPQANQTYSRILTLQHRVTSLQTTLYSIKQYLSHLQLASQVQQEIEPS